MGKAFFRVLALAAFVGSASARAELRVVWDCFLPDARVTCQDLHNTFFARVPFLREVPAGAPLNNDHPKIFVSVRWKPSSDSQKYALVIIGEGENRFERVEGIPNSMDSAPAVLRLVSRLHQGASLAMAATVPAEVSGESVVLTLGDPENGPPQGRPADKNEHWYVAPNLSGEFTQNAVQQINASAGVDVVYSDPSWKVIGDVDVSYRRIAIPQDGKPDEVSELFNIGGRAVVVRTIKGGWSVALIGALTHRPQNNTTVDAVGAVGTEWCLFPFRDSAENSLNVRYWFGGEYDRYVKPNVLNFTWQTFLVHGLESYMRWHFQPVDVRVWAGAESVVNRPEFTSVYAGAGVDWRITPSLIVSVTGDGSYRNRVISEPAPTVDGAPSDTERLLGAGNFGKFVYYGGVSLKYVFGNAELIFKDARWVQ